MSSPLIFFLSVFQNLLLLSDNPRIFSQILTKTHLCKKSSGDISHSKYIA
ncbi:hypothetical protein BRYFOR_05941 [Marvinbryantia formatexigens DSM 14469]|uniref:Uncharacterized protein n=1 Tax=Marvinbryantia formatexigens DSM 14469 TaxID=478749 RepID=C6LBE5_9FIRM|nr:hypothetical protein BRYFOR_05941 [Marvinbryantia formatexigens DSM 14469]